MHCSKTQSIASSYERAQLRRAGIFKHKSAALREFRTIAKYL